MPRKPQPGGDDGTWGALLNEFLDVAHNTDGTLKNGAVGTAVLNAAAPTAGQVLTYDGTGLSWSTPTSSGSVPDATASVKGLVQLTGDLGGTAASPTVPALAALTSHASNTSNPHGVTKAQIGLANVDNTSDANKPISTATQTALNAKANLASPTFTGTVTVPTPLSNNAAATKSYVDTVVGSGAPDATASVKGLVQLTGDLGGTAASPTVPGLAGKANATHAHAASDITSGTVPTARLGSGTANSTTFLRGDNTWATPAGGGGGGVGLTAIGQTSNYTANPGEFVIANAAAGGFTITLPTPANGINVSVKKVDATVNAILVVPPSGQIDDQASVAVNAQWQSQDFFSDGTTWYRV